MRHERTTIPACDLPAWKSRGWSLVRDQPSRQRGTDLLVERVSESHPVGSCVPVPYAGTNRAIDVGMIVARLLMWPAEERGRMIDEIRREVGL